MTRDRPAVDSTLSGRDETDIQQRVDNVEVINVTDDLPPVSNGRHQLEDNTVYYFSGQIESEHGLEFGTFSVITGGHRENDWFIHTGGDTALVANNTDFLHQNMGVNAPGGTIFDIGGTEDSEMLVDSVYYADDQERGNIADLGRIGAFRSPTISRAGFRDFDSGVNIVDVTGRLSVDFSIIRDVTAPNVTVFTFESTFDADVVEYSTNYFRDLQSDTVIIDFDNSAVINDVFQYRGNTHDGTVTKTNILTGAADPKVEPFWVSNSHPLRDSAVVGEMTLDTSTETTINSQDTFTQVSGATSIGNETQRVSQQSNGILRYDGAKEINADIGVSASVYGANGDLYDIGLAKNGTVQPTSIVRIQGRGQNANIPMSVGAIEDLVTDDTISIQVKNISGTNNITFQSYVLKYMGV